MNNVKPWHEDDEFWEAMAPMLFDEQRWASAPVEIDQVTSLLDIHPGAAVLDLCCGPGRHSLELARRGYRVTGVDRTAAYLEQADKLARSEGLTIEFMQRDMRHFCRSDTFDAALSLFTSFGYFEDQDENRQVLINVHRSLKAGGKLIIELMGKEVLARIFRDRDWREQDGTILLEERKVSENWTRMDNRWILLQGQSRHEFRFSHWIYSAAELTALLADSGFGSVDVYGSREGTPYDNAAVSLVAVAHK